MGAAAAPDAIGAGGRDCGCGTRMGAVGGRIDATGADTKGLEAGLDEVAEAEGAVIERGRGMAGGAAGCGATTPDGRLAT